MRMMHHFISEMKYNNVLMLAIFLSLPETKHAREKLLDICRLQLIDF